MPRQSHFFNVAEIFLAALYTVLYQIVDQVCREAEPVIQKEDGFHVTARQWSCNILFRDHQQLFDILVVLKVPELVERVIRFGDLTVVQFVVCGAAAGGCGSTIRSRRSDSGSGSHARLHRSRSDKG